MLRLVKAWLPPPRILHPWPAQRFDVNHLGGSRVRKWRLLGSVREVLSNAHPHREQNRPLAAGQMNLKQTSSGIARQIKSGPGHLYWPGLHPHL